jgi:hypothetical protein
MLAVPVQIFLRHRVESHRLRISVKQAGQPGFARLVVPALDAAAVVALLSPLRKPAHRGEQE